MTLPIAAVGRSTPATALEATTPSLFIDGVPEADLQVTRLTCSLPLDTRRAEAVWLPARSDSSGLLGRELTIAVPHLLCDGETRWEVLISGSAALRDKDESAGKDQASVEIEDRLTSFLAEPADTLGDWPQDGIALIEVVDRLGKLLQAGVFFACDTGLLESRIEVSTLTARSLGVLLSRELEFAGLCLHQDLRLEGDRVNRTLLVMPERSGRRVALPWPDSQGRGGAVLRIESQAGQQPPRAWVAEGDRPVVEDTFLLSRGWDPALAGQPDSDYDRLASTDYSLYGSVYRAWVLNEDGAFSAEPFNLGDAFNAGALFDVPGSIHTPLRFIDCLARDASGRRISPVIESSTDSGANWSAYPGKAEVMTERAGILLTDDTLPAPILSAAKAGTLRMRVTASLTGPGPISDRRWDGNPFVGAGPTRRLSFGGRFGWRRVASSSIHAGAIEAGQLSADQVDDRGAMRVALREAVIQSPGPEVRAVVDLRGAWTALRAGDRAHAVLGPGLAIDSRPKVFGGREARVYELRIDFGVGPDSPRTRLYFD